MNFSRLFSLIFLLYFRFSVNAQISQSEIDKILSSKSIVQQAYVYDSLSVYYLNQNAGLAYGHSNKAYEIIIETNDEKKKGIVLTNRAKAFRQMGDYEKALKDLDLALKYFLNTGSKSWVSSVHVDFGNIYYTKGDFNKSISSYMDALNIAEEIDDLPMQAACVNNIGNIYFYKENFDKAITFYTKGYEINKKLGDDKRVALTLDNIGLVYFNKGDFDKAMTYQTSALSIIEKIGDKRMLAETLMNLGGLCLEMDRNATALGYLERAYIIHTEIGNKYGVSTTLINQADAYRKLKKYSDALKVLEESAILSKELDAKNNLKEIYLSFSHIYEDLHQYTKALEYYKYYSNTKDSVINEQSNAQINELATKYETDKKQKEIELLTKDQEVKNERIARQNIITYSFIFSLLLVIGISFITYKRYREKKKANILISAQKEVVELKQKEILDSIHYAKRIQKSLLPTDIYIDKILHRLNE